MSISSTAWCQSFKDAVSPHQCAGLLGKAISCLNFILWKTNDATLIWKWKLVVSWSEMFSASTSHRNMKYVICHLWNIEISNWLGESLIAASKSSNLILWSNSVIRCMFAVNVWSLLSFLCAWSELMSEATIIILSYFNHVFYLLEKWSTSQKLPP